MHRFLTHKQSRYYSGVLAEGWARLFLHLKGYRHVASRMKTPLGEIDLIMQTRQQLIFVEVKKRKRAEDGLYAITTRNQIRVARAAEWFLKQQNIPQKSEFRFDIIVVSCYGKITHLKHAFDAPLRTA